MNRGIYVAATAGILRMMDVDNIANNVANISTNGYKRTSFSSRLYPVAEGRPQTYTALHPEARAMVHFDRTSIDHGQGTTIATGNPLEISIQGEGFFVVEAKGQQKAYTRNGAFSMDKEGFLINSSGYKVIGTDDRPLQINMENKGTPTIGADGTISVEGNTLGTIKLVKLTDARNMSESLYSGKEDGQATGSITQGSVEKSNVQPLREMVGLITAQREFQSLQQVIKTFDQLSQWAANEIAKV